MKNIVELMNETEKSKIEAFLPKILFDYKCKRGSKIFQLFNMSL